MEMSLLMSPVGGGFSQRAERADAREVTDYPRMRSLSISEA
jgi:hypothetical protein